MGDKVILAFDGKKAVLIPKSVNIVEIIQRKRFNSKWIGKEITDVVVDIDVVKKL